MLYILCIFFIVIFLIPVWIEYKCNQKQIEKFKKQQKFIDDFLNSLKDEEKK